MSILHPSHLLLPFLLPRLSSRLFVHNLHTSGPSSSPPDTLTPNQPLDLDPALQALLKDADLSLSRSSAKSRKRRKHDSSGAINKFAPPAHRELEVLDATLDSQSAEKHGLFDEDMNANVDAHDPFPRSERKSPAASFGSRGIGAVVLPFELQRSILRLISESDKPLIHADAQRLFRDSATSEAETSDRYTPRSWSMRYTSPSYTEPKSNSKMSHIKARLNRQRDGTAFASVVMPAQYAVVRAVLEGVKTRLGDEWAGGVDRVVEWGSGTGAGMWAALHTFRNLHPDPIPNPNAIPTSPSNAPNATATMADSTPKDSHDEVSAPDKPLEQPPDPSSKQEAQPASSSSEEISHASLASEPEPPNIDPFPLPIHDHPSDLSLGGSSIVTYTGIDKRDGLTTIARRLLRDIPHRTSVSLQKTLHPTDRVPRASASGLGSVALSAFMLNAAGNPILRREMVKEMWESGADVLVIIDDGSAEGFRHVADAREYLLKLGRREVDAVALEKERAASSTAASPGVKDEATIEDDDGRGKRGSHIIAPCPHDRACPLAFHQLPSSAAHRSSAVQSSSSSVRCTFAQRLQRPAFVRRTKHAGRGEEDVGYAYVVVRRGMRVRGVAGDNKVLKGRVGAVGRWAEEAAREREMAREDSVGKGKWTVDEDGVEAGAVVEEGGNEVVHVEEGKEGMVPVDGLLDELAMGEPVEEDVALKGKELEDTLRNESYGWPRINFPPLKRNGHVLIDACMPEGSIMRMTFPRSQGKQIYYDARKSDWGDIFPHIPKHRPVPRYTGSKSKTREPVAVATSESAEDLPLSKEEEKTLNRLMGLEAAAEEKAEKAKREKGRGRGRGGEGALNKAGLVNEGRAGWGGVMDSLKVEDRRRRRERKEGRGAKEVEGF